MPFSLALLVAAAQLAAAPARIVAFGGSVGPDQTPLALERALKPLDGHAQVLLFAGGDPQHMAVTVEPPASAPSLRERLGRRMGQQAGLGQRYRATRLRAVTGAARLPTLRQAIVEQGRQLGPGQALLVVGVGHGDLAPDGGSEALLWEDDALLAEPLAQELDRSLPDATVALLLGHCYGGDFARIAHRGADLQRPTTSRCGLFATTADRLADGCDARRGALPNFVELAARALAAAPRRLDLDGDGWLSLRELQAELSVIDPSINLPTLSSEPLLREQLDPDAVDPGLTLARMRARADPVRRRILDGLGRRAGLPGATTLAQLDARLDALEDQLDAAQAQRDLLGAEQEQARVALVDRIADRWPALLNPYRDDFEATLAQAAPELGALLRDDPAARLYDQCDDELDRLDAWTEPREQAQARLLRLVRALEDVALEAQAAADPQLVKLLRPVEACEAAPLVPVGAGSR